MYFVQGVAEPSEGLIAQPLRSMMTGWGRSAGEIGAVAAILSLPWSLKPLYGLLTDFVPLARTRRKGYLVLVSAIATASLALLYALRPGPDGYTSLVVLLTFATLAVAFSDVVVDALMVEIGKPRGLTGTLQSAQWAALYGGSVAAGLAGGWLSQRGLQRHAFLVCAVTSAAMLALSLFVVREPERPREAPSLRHALSRLRDTARLPSLRLGAAFLLLWSFNPFSRTVLYLHLTRELRLTEQSYGVTVSVVSVGAIAGSLSYAAYCRRVAIGRLLYLAVAAGVVSTVAYAFVAGPRTAFVVSAVVGFAYITGSMVQFDLAARLAPADVAGTTFAALMAVSNLGVSLAGAAGGQLYETLGARWGARAAFDALVGAGALTTAACALLVPAVVRSLEAAEGGAAPTDAAREGAAPSG